MLLPIGRVIAAAVFVVLFAISTARADDNTRDIQQILNNLGYDAGSVDGAWGRKTRIALQKYAKEKSIEFDGKLTGKIHTAVLAANPGLLTGPRHLKKALSGPVAKMFPLGNKGCTGFNSRTSRTPTYYRTVTRKVYGKTRIGGFIDAVGYSVAEHLGEKARRGISFSSGESGENLDTFTSHLVKAAKSGAFTRLNFNGRGPNPAHWVSALLHNLAFFVNYADRENLWQAGQREIIVKWGNRLYAVSHRVSGPGSGRAVKSVRWPDTVGMQALAYISWGVAVKNLDAFKEGMDDWFWLHRLIRAGGGMKTFLNGGRWQNTGGAKNNDFSTLR